MKRNTIIFGLFLLTFLMGAGFGVFFIPDISNQNIKVSESIEEIEIDLIIDYGDGNIQNFPEKIFWEGATILDTLKALERRHGISIETREFPEIGIFIEAIHGVRNTRDMYWQFWVNGEYGAVGAGQYNINDGDEILWRRTGER